ncbi:unnamed protein product, partial [Rotaria sordida]
SPPSTGILELGVFNN